MILSSCPSRCCRVCKEPWLCRTLASSMHTRRSFLTSPCPASYRALTAGSSPKRGMTLPSQGRILWLCMNRPALILMLALTKSTPVRQSNRPSLSGPRLWSLLWMQPYDIMLRQSHCCHVGLPGSHRGRCRPVKRVRRAIPQLPRQGRGLHGVP